MCLELCVFMLIILVGSRHVVGQSIPLCSGDAVNFTGSVPLNQISGGRQQKLRFDFSVGGISLIHPLSCLFKSKCCIGMGQR